MGAPQMEDAAAGRKSVVLNLLEHDRVWWPGELIFTCRVLWGESYFALLRFAMRAKPVVLTVLTLLATMFSFAQFSEAQQQGAWVPQGIVALEESASSKTGFTFDHSMLVLVSQLDSGNEDLRRVIAGVSAISVQQLHFHRSEQYNPGVLDSVIREYKAAGWKQLMNERDKSGIPGATDLWVRLENNAISNVAFLVAKPDGVSFITVSGSISPADLSHLGGHFGIPKIEGGVVVRGGSGR